MYFYPQHCCNNKTTKKAKAYLVNQFKKEQKSSIINSPTKTAKRKLRKLIQFSRSNKEFSQDLQSGY